MQRRSGRRSVRAGPAEALTLPLQPSAPLGIRDCSAQCCALRFFSG